MGYFKMFTGVDVIWRDITEPFVVTPVVVVADERLNSPFEFAGHVIWYKANVSFDNAVVSSLTNRTNFVQSMLPSVKQRSLMNSAVSLLMAVYHEGSI